MSAPYTFPYDPTGEEASNLIEDEVATLVALKNTSKASIIIPDSAPFFKESLEIWTGPNKTGTKLIEGQDYILAYECVALTFMISRVIYGGIMIIDRQRIGTVYVTYQTLGGEYTLSSHSMFEGVYSFVNGVFFYTWDMIVGLPATFTPEYHLHAESDQTMQQVLTKLDAVLTAVNAHIGPIGS